MKRVLVIALAIVCGMTCSDCFAQEPADENLEQTSGHERSALSLYQELMKIERERMELEKKMAEMEKEMQKPVTGPLLDEMELPCQEEAKSTDEYYGAWAVSDGQMNQNYAVQDAMQKARLELAKQLGGEDLSTLTYEVVCQRIMRDHLGNYIAYVAVRMPKNR